MLAEDLIQATKVVFTEFASPIFFQMHTNFVSE